MKPKILKQEIIKLKSKWNGEFVHSNNSIVQFMMDKKNGWEQFGASKNELWVTTPIVEKLWNDFVYQ